MAACLDISSVSPQMNPSFNAKVLNYKILDDGKYAVFNIQITVDGVQWTVERRYSEFDAFDQKRFPDRKKSFLPGKKLLNNLDPEFLEERGRELEKYTRALLELEVWHQKHNRVNSLPLNTAKFFDFDQYEIHSIVDDLSLRLGAVGDKWLSSVGGQPKYFEFTPIELHAVTKRLKLAEPTAPDPTGDADIANTIEFLHRVKALKVKAMKNYVRNSNIVEATLNFTLAYCKNLYAIWISDFDVKQVSGLMSLRGNLHRIVIHYSMKRLQDLLIDEELPVPIEEAEQYDLMEQADFSFNDLEEIDESVRLLGPIRILNFSHNHIEDVGPFVQHLAHLTELDLTKNNISSVARWNEKLGNLKKLILADNKIKNLEGLSKIYSLEHLDVSNNEIVEVDDVQPIGRLPCLEDLILRGNPVRRKLDYRAKVLEAFGERCKEVYLDNRKTEKREMDTVRLRLALRKAKEEKEAQERNRLERIQERIRYIEGGVDGQQQLEKPKQQEQQEQQPGDDGDNEEGL